MENNKQPLTDSQKIHLLFTAKADLSLGADETVYVKREQAETLGFKLADEQTKPLKEEVERLNKEIEKLNETIKWHEETISGYSDEWGLKFKQIAELEYSISLAKKENEELAQQLSDKELEYVNEVGKTYNLIDVIKLSKAELTSVKGHLTENKNNLLSVCEYFVSMENAELNHKQLETFLINLGGKLNESLNNYKK